MGDVFGVAEHPASDATYYELQRSRTSSTDVITPDVITPPPPPPPPAAAVDCQRGSLDAPAPASSGPLVPGYTADPCGAAAGGCGGGSGLSATVGVRPPAVETW